MRRLAPLLLLTGCAPRPAPPPALPPGFVVARPVAPLFAPEQAHALLEGPGRDRWQRPEALVARLALRPGERVADIGAGSGYLLPYLSRAVGPAGRVAAQEVQDDFLPALRKRAKALGNVDVALGTPGDPKLPRRDIDCFVLLTVYHEVDHPVDFLKTLAGYAAPGARLAIVDFDSDRRGEPPPPEGHSVRASAVQKEAAAAGWRLTARHEIIPSQFYLVFTRGFPGAPRR
jgi:predicted methyltransferase